MPLFAPFEAVKKYFQATFNGTADKTVANTTTETSIMPTGTGNKTIPAGWLQEGRSVRVIGNGVYGVAALGGNLTIKVKIGSVVVATGQMPQLVALLSNQGFDFSVTMTCRSVTGNTGKVTGGGRITFGLTGNGRNFVDLISSAPMDVDVSVDQTVDVTIQYAAALAANTITTKIATIEQLEN